MSEQVKLMVECASWAHLEEARAERAEFGEDDDSMDAWGAHFREASAASDVLSLALPVASFRVELARRKVIREEAGVVDALTEDDYMPLEIPASAWAEFRAADEAAHRAQHDAFAVAYEILWPYRPDDGDTGVMTPQHPRWSEFADRLYGPEGCNFVEEPEHDGHPTFTWQCGSGTDKTFAETILRTIDGVDVEGSLQYFEAHGGYCDCEILFNVDPYISGEGIPDPENEAAHG